VGEHARLPHRGIPSHSGGYDYHIITVYGVNDAAGTATIGDLTDEPVEVPLAALTRRGDRFAKTISAARHSTGQESTRLEAAREREPESVSRRAEWRPARRKRRKNFSLDALALWAERLTSTKDKERWERVFMPGNGSGAACCRSIDTSITTATAAASAADDGRVFDRGGHGDQNAGAQDGGRPLCETRRDWSDLPTPRCRNRLPSLRSPDTRF